MGILDVNIIKNIYQLILGTKIYWKHWIIIKPFTTLKSCFFFRKRDKYLYLSRISKHIFTRQCHTFTAIFYIFYAGTELWMHHKAVGALVIWSSLKLQTEAACFHVSVNNRSRAERGSGCICAPYSSGLQCSDFDLKQDRWMQIMAVG